MLVLYSYTAVELAGDCANTANTPTQPTIRSKLRSKKERHKKVQKNKKK